MSEHAHADDADRRRAIRLLLYPVMFSADLTVEVKRVAGLCRAYPDDQRSAILRTIRAELANPRIAVADIEGLESRSTESQVRAYLEAVIDLIDHPGASEIGERRSR